MDDLSSRRHSYVVTAHKPTAVGQCAVGNFAGCTSTDLIIAKSTRLEIHTLTPSGLEAKLDVPIYGRISALKLFKPSTKSQSMLFIMTERYKFCVLEYTPEGKLVTVANGDVEDTIGRPAECGHICVIDDDATMIGLHMYDGHFKIIPVDEDGGISEQAFNVRLDELRVIDLAFVGKGTLGVLHEDTKGARHLKTYRVSKGGLLEEGAMKVANVDGGMICGLGGDAGDGCLIVGKQVVTKLSCPTGSETTSSSYGYGDGQAVMMKTWARVNGTTVLLGDSAGGLYVCEHGGADVRVQRVGSTSVPSALAYLDSGVVFVGSALGDSQLVRIGGEGVDVVDEMVNLGPIVDFICVESGLVVCGGSGIRNVRFGVGVTELGAAPLPGSRRVWGVGDRVVVGLAGGENVVLGLVDGEVADVSEAFGGLMKVAEKTVECFECSGKVVQVTTSAVYCDGKPVWTSGAGVEVLHAAISAGSRSLLLATRSANTRMASVVDCHNGQLSVEFALAQEPSSCAIWDDRLNGGPLVCSATLWDGSVMVWNDGQACTEALGDDQMPRSVRIKKQDNDLSILVGTGQGLAISWRLAGTRLEDRQQVPIGYQPVILRDLGSEKIAAIGSSTAVMDGRGATWAMVNTGVNTRVFDAALWQDYIVVVVEDEIKFWELSDKSGCQIDRLKIDSSVPRRVAALGSENGRSISSSTILVATSTGVRESIELRSEDGAVLNDEIELGDQIICSLCATKTGAPGYYVGTAVNGESREPEAGFVMKFEVTSESRLQVGQKIATNALSLADHPAKPGPVYSLATTPSGLLIAGVGSSVVIYKEDESGGLELVTQIGGFSVVLDVSAVLSDEGRVVKIAVADLMRSVTLLGFDAEKQTLSTIARELSPRWLSAALLVDEDRVVFADSDFHLGVLQQNTGAADEDVIRLTNLAERYSGNFINRFRVGRLSSLAATDVVIFGCISGAIGLVASITEGEHTILSRLQNSLENMIGAVGGFDVKGFRSPSNLASTSRSSGAGSLIDGDICEMLLELNAADRKEALSCFDDVAEADAAVAVVQRLALLH